MARLVYSEAFVEDMLAVELESKRDETLRTADLLSDFPGLGSRNLPESIRRRFGDSVRKLAVAPFDVIYEHDPETDVVSVLGLVHQRAAY